MEKVETRDPAWVEVAFHPEELPGGEEADPAALTRLWTGKEAVLKLLALGLSVDLWDVRLGPGPEPRVRLFDKALERHRELGSPEIRVCTMDVPQHVLSVAYTPARGGPGEGGGAHGPVG